MQMTALNWLTYVCITQFHVTMGDQPQLRLPIKEKLSQIRAYKPGDYVIGGIFPVHIDINNNESLSEHCTRFNDIGLAWVEAMIHATAIVSNSEILPNITIGYDIRDDCDEMFLASEIALDFVSTPERRYIYPSSHHRFVMSTLNKTNTSTTQAGNEEIREQLTEQPIVAVVGPASSDTAISTAHIFSALRLPQISYSATSTILSDRSDFLSFFRIIPSDTYQVKAMVDIMVFFNWTYISLFGSDDSYGQLGMSSFEYEACKRNIDIAVKKRFSYKGISQMVSYLTGYMRNNPIVYRSNVLVIFAESHYAYALIKEFQKHNFTDKTFFGTESWTSSNWFLNLPSSVMKGSLGIVAYARQNDDFAHFFKTDTVQNALQRNPWFSEFISLRNSKTSTYNQILKKEPNIWDAKNMDPKQTLQELFGVSPMSLNKAAYVRDAVYVIAHALKKLLCTGDTCEKKCVSNELVMAAIVDTDFDGVTGHIKFDKHGDVPGSFTILNIQNSGDDKLRFTDVGMWNQSVLDLNTEYIVWKGGEIVTSRCTDECFPGYRKLFGTDNDCWTCVQCENDHFSNVTNMELCESCILLFGPGWSSNTNKTKCQPLPWDYLNWDENLSVALLAASAIFSLLTFISLSLYIRFRNSYVIKGSNRELTYALFAILFSCFLSSFLYIGRPNKIMCIVQPTYIALVLTSLMLIILYKTYRILVIFELPPTNLVNIQADRKSRDRRHHLCFLAVEFIVFSAMCLSTYSITPGVTFHYYSENIFIDCGPNWEYLNYVALSIFGALTVVNVYMAYRVRKLPENFNEAHQISTAVYILFLVWIVTLIAILGPQAKKKSAYVCISLQLQAVVILLAMIFPKLKVVLCNPAKDTPQAIRLQTIAYVMKEQSKHNHVDTPVLVRSPKLSNVEPGQYEMGDHLGFQVLYALISALFSVVMIFSLPLDLDSADSGEVWLGIAQPLPRNPTCYLPYMGYPLSFETERKVTSCLLRVFRSNSGI